MRILLVRHAEPDYARDSLTPKGRREAELLSRRLCRLDVKAFYVSPLGRAQDTAAYTLSKVNRAAETLPWLAEFRGRCYDAMAGESRIPWDYRPRQWNACRSCSIPVRGWKARCWLRVTSSKSGRKLLPAWTPCWPGTATTGMAPFTAVPTTVPIRWCSFATLALPLRCSATCAAFHPFPCGRASACFLLP